MRMVGDNVNEIHFQYSCFFCVFNFNFVQKTLKIKKQQKISSDLATCLKLAMFKPSKIHEENWSHFDIHLTIEIIPFILQAISSLRLSPRTRRVPLANYK